MTNRDDRVQVTTRILGAIIVPFLLVAFGMLYLFPADTGRWFAWEIKPRMTPLLMGAGYFAGAYFFVQVVISRKWHRVHIGFLPITAFTLFLGIATLAHLDRFNHNHIAFWVWTALYLTTPVLVPLAWIRNRVTDPGELESKSDLRLSPRVRIMLFSVGAVMFAVAAVLLLSPPTMIRLWPWMLTPLTAQVIGGWFALPGVVALMMAIDGRWSAISVTLHSQMIGLVFILAAVARAWSDFDASNVLTYVFAGGLSLLLLALVGLDLRMRVMQRGAPGGIEQSPVNGRDQT